MSENIPTIAFNNEIIDVGQTINFTTNCEYFNLYQELVCMLYLPLLLSLSLSFARIHNSIIKINLVKYLFIYTYIECHFNNTVAAEGTSSVVVVAVIAIQLEHYSCLLCTLITPTLRELIDFSKWKAWSQLLWNQDTWNIRRKHFFQVSTTMKHWNDLIHNAQWRKRMEKRRIYFSLFNWLLKELLFETIVASVRQTNITFPSISLSSASAHFNKVKKNALMPFTLLSQWHIQWNWIAFASFVKMRKKIIKNEICCVATATIVHFYCAHQL